MKPLEYLVHVQLFYLWIIGNNLCWSSDRFRFWRVLDDLHTMNTCSLISRTDPTRPDPAAPILSDMIRLPLATPSSDSAHLLAQKPAISFQLKLLVHHLLQQRKTGSSWINILPGIMWRISLPYMPNNACPSAAAGMLRDAAGQSGRSALDSFHADEVWTSEPGQDHPDHILWTNLWKSPN